IAVAGDSEGGAPDSALGEPAAPADTARTAGGKQQKGVDPRQRLTRLRLEQVYLPAPLPFAAAAFGCAPSHALIWRDRQRRLAAQVLAYPPMDPACRAQSFRRNPEMFPSRAGL
ncbi:hypothetical protein, partial [Saccharothrix sp. ST-888]|uniref:hypothetical protein n=1 Tax=Saccharothrix sp. ST-888 TaxID=1427391 RepID=UPI0005ED049B